jgi:hypothetical protein
VHRSLRYERVLIVVSKFIVSLIITVIYASALAACSSIQPTPEATATSLPSSTPSPLPTATPVPTATAIRTPPALPAVFLSGELNPLDAPHTYIPDTCQYLKDKWASTNSAPGTVLMPIMFHSISKEGETNANQVSLKDFDILMNDLHSQDFNAITMQQASDFLNHNAKIPARSALLIVDDRHYAQYFNEFFRQYHEDWGWPVVNAFISLPDTLQVVWDENAALEKEGWVDHQAHGVVHNIPINPGSSDEYILGELQGSITAIQQHFGKTPIAFIWPGGGFTPHAAELASQVGYQLGFTINPRGPVMFNWVPLANESDLNRQYFMPEGEVKNPLMVLPRYWDTDADAHIDAVRRVGQEAAKYANTSKPTELEYYGIVCEPQFGLIP